MRRIRNSRRLWIATAFLVALIGVPVWQTYREVQRARASVTLIAAIKHGDTPAALAALDAGTDPNAVDDPEAASFKQILRQWWERLRGHKPTSSDKLTALPLAIAPSISSERGEGDSMVSKPPENIVVVKALLDRGADVESIDAALYFAVVMEHENTVHLLLERGAKVSFGQAVSPLCIAAMDGNANIVRMLLAKGANPNEKDSDGDTALMSSAQIFGSAEAVKVLLDAGTDPNSRDASGNTALSLARNVNNTEIIALLKKRGAK